MRAQRERYGAPEVAVAPTGASGLQHKALGGLCFGLCCSQRCWDGLSLCCSRPLGPGPSTPVPCPALPAVPVDMPAVPVSPGPEHVQVRLAARTANRAWMLDRALAQLGRWHSFRRDSAEWHVMAPGSQLHFPLPLLPSAGAAGPGTQPADHVHPCRRCWRWDGASGGGPPADRGVREPAASHPLGQRKCMAAVQRASGVAWVKQ